MPAFTFLPGVTYYIINVRTGRALSFGALETAAKEISGLRPATPLIVVKNTSEGPRIVFFAEGKLTAEEIQETISRA